MAQYTKWRNTGQTVIDQTSDEDWTVRAQVRVDTRRGEIGRAAVQERGDER